MYKNEKFHQNSQHQFQPNLKQIPKNPSHAQKMKNATNSTHQFVHHDDRLLSIPARPTCHACSGSMQPTRTDSWRDSSPDFVRWSGTGSASLTLEKMCTWDYSPTSMVWLHTKRWSSTFYVISQRCDIDFKHNHTTCNRLTVDHYFVLEYKMVPSYSCEKL